MTENKTENLQEKLQEIKDQEGIIGYILRDEKSASIDLKDPKKDNRIRHVIVHSF
jgi:hypothetical protein